MPFNSSPGRAGKCFERPTAVYVSRSLTAMYGEHSRGAGTAVAPLAGVIDRRHRCSLWLATRARLRVVWCLPRCIDLGPEVVPNRHRSMISRVRLTIAAMSRRLEFSSYQTGQQSVGPGAKAKAWTRLVMVLGSRASQVLQSRTVVRVLASRKVWTHTSYVEIEVVDGADHQLPMTHPARCLEQRGR
jgi:hypothetical protein